GAFALAARGKTARGDVGARTEAVRPGWRERLPELKSSKESAWLVPLYAASGFVAMLYEVAWTRVLVLVLGSSTYAYTIMLTTFLLGLALGAWLATRVLRELARPLLAAGLCQLAIALATYLSLFLVEELPFVYLK